MQTRQFIYCTEVLYRLENALLHYGDKYRQNVRPMAIGYIGLLVLCIGIMKCINFQFKEQMIDVWLSFQGAWGCVFFSVELYFIKTVLKQFISL